MKKTNKMYLIAGFSGAILTVLLTLLIYMTFFQNFLEQFNGISDHVVALISQTHPHLWATILANVAHGFLIATVIRWGNFYTIKKGAVSAATVGFLTEIYFCFTQYAMFKTMTPMAAICDTLMWTFINLFVGAFIS